MTGGPLPPTELQRREVPADLGRAGDLREDPGEMDADEHEPDRDDAEVQAADAHGRRPDEQTDRRRADAGSRQPDPDREPETPGAAAFLAADHGCRIGADAHEEGVAQGDLPGDTGEQVEPEGGDDEDHRLGDDA